MMDMKNFIPAEKTVTRGGKNRKKGSMTMICSEKNGKRLMISENLADTLRLKDMVKIGFIGKELLLGITLPGERNEYKLKRQGKKLVIYSSELISLIAECQGINFKDKVSHTWYKAKIDEHEKLPVAIFEPEGGDNCEE